MDRQIVIEKTIGYVQKILANDSSGHDWWHVYRVSKIAKQLATEESADGFVVELAALLHDIGDWKFNDNQECGPEKAAVWLNTLQVDKNIIDHVCEIIQDISFKGAGTQNKEMRTLEGKIVQDADRLDAIGAIGIGRTFAYGGYKGRPLYDPNIKPTAHQTFEAYKNNQGTTINHFYEKLFLLKDRMNTIAAKRMAQERHDIMQTFVNQFLQEWEVES